MYFLPTLTKLVIKAGIITGYIPRIREKDLACESLGMADFQCLCFICAFLFTWNTARFSENIMINHFCSFHQSSWCIGVISWLLFLAIRSMLSTSGCIVVIIVTGIDQLTICSRGKSRLVNFDNPLLTVRQVTTYYVGKGFVDLRCIIIYTMHTT